MKATILDPRVYHFQVTAGVEQVALRQDAVNEETLLHLESAVFESLALVLRNHADLLFPVEQKVNVAESLNDPI